MKKILMKLLKILFAIIFTPIGIIVYLILATATFINTTFENFVGFLMCLMLGKI